MKSIIIYADGTCNRHEQIHKDNYPTNVLKFARDISAHDEHGIEQVVFYECGIGSYHDKLSGGRFCSSLKKMGWMVTAF